jgi:hypothetical protein
MPLINCAKQALKRQKWHFGNYAHLRKKNEFLIPDKTHFNVYFNK